MKSLGKNINIKIGTILGFVTLVINVLVYIFYTPFLLKMVGDRQYGIYSFAIGITTWFSFASSSIAIGYVRFNSISKSSNSKFDNKTLNGCYFIIFFIYSLIVLLVALVFSILMLTGIVKFEKYNTDEQNAIIVMFIVTILSLIPTLLFQVFSSSIYANGKFIWYRLSAVFNILLRTTISIPFLIMGCNIIAVVIIHAIVNVVLVLADVFYAFFGLKIRLSFKQIKQYKFLFKEIFFFTGALLVNEVADKLNSSIDTLILGSCGYAIQITHYTIGMRVAEYSTQAVLTVAKNFAPTANDNVVENKHEENKNLFLRISLIQLVFSALFIGGFYVCGKDFIYLWLGNGYEDVYYICLVLMILYSYMSTTIMTQDIERANNKHLGRSLIILGTCVFNAVTTYLLVMFLPERLIIFGCLLGTGVGIVIGYFIILSLYHKTSVNMPMLKYWKNVLITLVVVLPIIIFSSRIEMMLPFISNNHFVLLCLKGFAFCFLFTPVCFLIFKKRKQNVIL